MGSHYGGSRGGGGGGGFRRHRHGGAGGGLLWLGLAYSLARKRAKRQRRVEKKAERRRRRLESKRQRAVAREEREMARRDHGDGETGGYAQALARYDERLHPAAKPSPDARRRREHPATGQVLDELHYAGDLLTALGLRRLFAWLYRAVEYHPGPLVVETPEQRARRAAERAQMLADAFVYKAPETIVAGSSDAHPASSSPSQPPSGEQPASQPATAPVAPAHTGAHEHGDQLLRDLCDAPFKMRKEDARALILAAQLPAGLPYADALARVLATRGRTAQSN